MSKQKFYQIAILAGFLDEVEALEKTKLSRHEKAEKMKFIYSKYSDKLDEFYSKETGMNKVDEERKITPMTDTLDKIDEMLINQVIELIKLAKKQQQEVIQSYLKRGIYE